MSINSVLKIEKVTTENSFKEIWKRLSINSSQFLEYINMDSEDFKKFEYADTLMEFGKFSDKTAKEVIEIWKELSEKGYIISTFYLGVCYENGIGCDPDVIKAFQCYLSSANEGHPESQYNVHLMYLDGIGVEKDESQSLKWLKDAAV